jgi:hypothetical protein
MALPDNAFQTRRTLMKVQGTDYLKPFLEATIASAARFRRVLIVLIVSSVLAFGAFWNAVQWSWLNSRIKLVRTAEAVLAVDEINEELGTLQASTERAHLLLAEKSKYEALLVGRDVGNARRWLKLGGFTTSESLNRYAERLELSRQQHALLIPVPGLGRVFDINDLGLLGGFTFVVVLMWFRFSLWREYFNLYSTFEEARTLKDLEYCYKYLAMNQVLTVPPILCPTTQPKERPWGKVVRYLYVLPVAVQLAVFSYDCYTFDLGWVINPVNTVVSIVASFCFLVLSVLLVYWCLRLSSEIDNKWEEAARRIRGTDVLQPVATPQLVPGLVA